MSGSTLGKSGIPSGSPIAGASGQIAQPWLNLIQYLYAGTYGQPVAAGAGAGAAPDGSALAIAREALAASGTAIASNSLSIFQPPTADLVMGGFQLSGLGTPSVAGQAAEYAWTLAQIQASSFGIASKPAVAAVATVNVSNFGTQTVDGVALAPGQRVLLTAQATASQNGPWIVASAGWSRPTDETSAELDPGALWLASGGTAYAGSQWQMTTTGAITPDTTPISIVQFSAGQSSSFSARITASAGIGVTGGTTTDTLAVTGSQAQGAVLAAPAGAAGAPSWRHLGIADVTGAAPLASPAFTGTLSLAGGALLTGGQIELGSTTATGTPYVDFHSSGSANDYDARIIATGGTAGTAGRGALTFAGSAFSIPGLASSSAAITGGAIDATPIGGTTPAAGAFSTISGKVQPTGASLARSLAARFADEANVLDFGADPTGSADSGPAFNAAFAAKGAVYAPAGTYKIATTILPNRAAMALRGAGPGLTVLMNSTTNQITLQLSSTVNCTEGWVSDLALDRSVTAVSGGDGFHTDGANTFTSGSIQIFNVLSQHNFNGFNLGNTAFSIADRCTAAFNQSNGFYLTNGTFNPACQWTLLNCLSQFNGASGYAVATTIPTQNLPSPAWSTTNPAYVTLNTWFYCTTFANRQNGIYLNGSATAPLCDFSLHGGWIGSDGADGLYANTFGINNRICETVFELNSNYGTATAGGGIGPGQNVAAPLTGNSVNITANNQDWSIIGGLINQPAYHGITTTAASTQIVGTRVFNCGFAHQNTYSGINAQQGHGAVIVSGCVSGGPLAGGGMQADGVIVYDASVAVIDGCDLRGNNIAAFAAATNIQLANINNNLGFISRNVGVVVIANGATSIVVNHQITGTPAIVLGTPASFFPIWEINQINYTSFTITFASPVTGTCYFQWMAMLSAYS